MKASEAASATVSVLSQMTREQRAELARILISDGLDRETRPTQIRAVVVRAVNEQAKPKAGKQDAVPQSGEVQSLVRAMGMT